MGLLQKRLMAEVELPLTLNVGTTDDAGNDGGGLPTPITISHTDSAIDESISGSHSSDPSYSATSFQSDVNAAILSNAELGDWDTNHISVWLQSINLEQYYRVLVK